VDGRSCTALFCENLGVTSTQDRRLWIWIYPWISTENLWIRIWIWMGNFISTASLNLDLVHIFTVSLAYRFSVRPTDFAIPSPWFLSHGQETATRDYKSNDWILDPSQSISLSPYLLLVTFSTVLAECPVSTCYAAFRLTFLTLWPENCCPEKRSHAAILFLSSPSELRVRSSFATDGRSDGRTGGQDP